MTVLFRCESALMRRLDALAKRKGVSRSDFVRRAVAAQVEREEAEETMTAWERLKPWVGSVSSGGKPTVSARDAGRQFADFLEEKDRERRSR